MGSRHQPTPPVPIEHQMDFLGIGKTAEAVGHRLVQRDNEAVSMLGASLIDFSDSRVSIFNPENWDGRVTSRAREAASLILARVHS